MNRTSNSSAITTETVTVVIQPVELAITYAENDSGQRCFIDAQSKIDFNPEAGQLLLATVAGRGYVISPTLAPAV